MNLGERNDLLIDAVKQCYRARREASDQLLGVINSSQSISDLNQNKMTVRFGQSELSFEVVEVSFVGRHMQIDIDELWKTKAFE